MQASYLLVVAGLVGYLTSATYVADDNDSVFSSYVGGSSERINGQQLHYQVYDVIGNPYAIDRTKSQDLPIDIHRILLSRRRRVAPLAAAVAGAVARGVMALKSANTVRKVLKGTKPGKNKPSKTVKEHISESKDPLADANKRFDSLKPKNVKDIGGKDVKGRQGDVGDMRITVRDKHTVKEKGTGKRTLVERPTVEVFKKNVPKKDRITIKVRHDKPVETPKSGSGSSGKSGGWWGGGKKSSKSSTGSGSKSSSGGSSKSGGGGWWRRKR